MIYGNIRHWEQEKQFFPSSFENALRFLDLKDVHSLANEKFLIDGDNIFALVQEYTTLPEETRRFEIHQEYIDIQFIIDGYEKQLYVAAPPDGPALLEDSLSTTDIAFCAAPPRHHSIILGPGDYAVYLPGEMHCPGCAVDSPDKVRKIVFKIRKPA